MSNKTDLYIAILLPKYLNPKLWVVASKLKMVVCVLYKTLLSVCCLVFVYFLSVTARVPQ